MPELTDSNELRQRIIAEARTRIATPPAEDEITTNMLAEELDCSKRQARIILQDMVEEGKATVRDNGIGGCLVFRLEEK
jgi:MarR-like DNA-binding transcriptional regulator SgrR of sgrS sRNA